MNTAMNKTENAENKMMYWEDLAAAPMRRYGPITITNQFLDQLLDIFGEKHPVHLSDSFARSIYRQGRIIPGAFIHSVTSGWVVQHADPMAIVGLRSVSWDFVRPIYPETPFYFTIETVGSEMIDERFGVLTTMRRVYDAVADQVCAIGRINVLVLRRSSQEVHQS
jgi:hypothetical protein